MKEKTYKAIGMMSGSSLDGLDIAYCEFKVADTENSSIPSRNYIQDWKIIHTTTIPFSHNWKGRLFHLPQMEAINFVQTHFDFGHYLGQKVAKFIEKHQLEPDFIAAHGHTIFHYPENKMTAQIGDGAAIAAITGYPTITNFRAQDVALGGQGAPIAPIAEQLLFKGYDFYLNLGGIANISCNCKEDFIAFDITAANQVLNELSRQLGMDYDEDGKISASGQLDDILFSQVNQLPYFKQTYPKSIDNQWLRKHILPFFLHHRSSVENRLHTACEHIAFQIKESIAEILKRENLQKEKYTLFITGGGALNKFLVQCIQRQCNAHLPMEIVLPKLEIIQFKEAVLMAIMGVLRVENKYNTIVTVTGAARNTIGGGIYQGWKKQI